MSFKFVFLLLKMNEKLEVRGTTSSNMFHGYFEILLSESYYKYHFYVTLIWNIVKVFFFVSINVGNMPKQVTTKINRKLAMITKLTIRYASIRLGFGQGSGPRCRSYGKTARDPMGKTPKNVSSKNVCLLKLEFMQWSLFMIFDCNKW